jgi:polysaccharide pyruvyl transferase WcaK-like protein
MGTDPTRPKIAIFGVFGAGNLGNECTLQAMLYNLRRYLPTAKFCCICAGPVETAATYKISAFPIREGRLPRTNNALVRFLGKVFVGIPLELYRWFKVISRLKGNDMLVMTGTGMLSDLGIVPLGLHYDILRWSIAAKLCRCRLLFVSVGVGPIRHRLSRFFVKAALGLANYRSYRDSFSKNYLESIGFKKDGDTVYPDLAFSLPRTMMATGPQRDKRHNVIGVGLIKHSRRRATSENDETIYQDYIAKVGAFVSWLLEREYTVRLLIGDVVYDGRARQDLKALLERDGLRYESGNIVDDPPQSVSELLSQLATTDVVIASRFHNVLLALMLGKPVVAISFHEKVDALMSAVGLTEFCQDIENIDLGKLTAQFAALEKNAERLNLQIQQNTEEYRKALDQQYKDILKASRVHELMAS